MCPRILEGTTNAVTIALSFGADAQPFFALLSSQTTHTTSAAMLGIFLGVDAAAKAGCGGKSGTSKNALTVGASLSIGTGATAHAAMLDISAWIDAAAIAREHPRRAAAASFDTTLGGGALSATISAVTAIL
jgi:hypothetical protein